MSLRLQQVGSGVISHSGSQGALEDGVLATDRSLSAGTACWAGLCIGLWCLQVMVSLATDQVNSAGNALWDGLFISGFVLWALGLLLAADQVISLGKLWYSAQSLNREFSLTFLYYSFVF